ncbi:MAG: hypothetical protein R3233_08940 [Xanthomonadales bacterium]|nr:hypothetical protein [Xanthomonadales bacterium]
MSRQSARWTLIGIFALFAIPVIAAFLMWTGRIDWRPGELRNAGQLIEPPRQTEILTLPGGEDLAGRWVLLEWVGDRCDEACMAEATDLRQVRRATGRDAGRVRVAALVGPALPVSERQALAAIGQELVVIEDVGGVVSDTLAATGESLGLDGARRWLLDPQGLLVLAYNPASGAGDVLEDLERLLKWSKVE